jgi:hypothetical protein
MPKNVAGNLKGRSNLRNIEEDTQTLLKYWAVESIYPIQDGKKLKIFWKHKQSLGFQCIGLFLDGLITYYPLNMSVLHTATWYLFYCILTLLVI